MATKKAVGRPPKYKCKEEIEEKIDAYFKKCEGEIQIRSSDNRKQQAAYRDRIGSCTGFYEQDGIA